MTRQSPLFPSFGLVAAALVAIAAVPPAGAQDATTVAPGRGKPTVDTKVIPAGFSNVVIFATNSVDLEQSSEVLTGSVVVNNGGSGATLGCSNRRLCVGIAVTTPQGYDIKADSIQVKSQATVFGTASCNSLLNNGNPAGLTCTPLALPVFATTPTFVTESPRPSAPDVYVPIGGSAVLPPGDYGHIDVRENGVVTFTGGVYNVNLIDFGIHTTVKFQAASEVRVQSKLSLDENSSLKPAAGSGITASDIVFYVAGINGNSGNLGATPKAAKLGIGTVVEANFYVPNGTLHIRQNALVTGAFLGRDVQVGLGAQVSLDSFFANQPPTAHPQDVATNGTAPLTITLTGSDPDGDDLVFSIQSGSGPTQGTLGPVTQGPPPSPGDPPGCELTGDCTTPPVPARNSATVVYTASTSGNIEDSFVFKVQDPSGHVGMATVRINTPGDPTTPDPPLTTVVALDASAETAKELAVEVKLEGGAPADVALSFAIVAGSGPAHGSLSSLTPGSESPQRSATVTYTPEAGFTGTDTFDFTACGTIGGTPTCDTARATITVVAGTAVANPQDLETPEDRPVTVTLTGTPGLFPKSAARFFKAAFLDGAEIAGNVADADGNGLGDNHNALPGPAPVLMAAAVDASGGPGSNGKLRMQIEWDMSGLRSLATSLTSAEVLLHTNKGTVDSLDTTFFVGTTDQDGLLTDGDFQAPATAISGVTMPVPAGPPGTEGTFSFDVLDEVRVAARNESIAFFSIQGRVDEGLAGGGFARGLQVYTTASGNLSSFLEPQLALATPGVTAPPLVFSILTLPTGGTLADSFAQPITTVPATLLDDIVVYTPNLSFTGADEFLFQVDDGASTASARIRIIVARSTCVNGVDPNGRPCN